MRVVRRIAAHFCVPVSQQESAVLGEVPIVEDEEELGAVGVVAAANLVS